MKPKLLCVTLIVCITAFSGCGGALKKAKQESEEWRKQAERLRAQIDKFGEQAISAADSIDPIALKELYRDVKDLQEVNQKLEKWIADAKANPVYPYIVRYTDTSNGGASIRVAAELLDSKNEPINLFSATTHTGTITKDPTLGYTFYVHEARVLDKGLPTGQYSLRVKTEHVDHPKGYSGKFQLFEMKNGGEHLIWTHGTTHEDGSVEITCDKKLIVGKYVPDKD